MLGIHRVTIATLGSRLVKRGKTPTVRAAALLLLAIVLVAAPAAAIDPLGGDPTVRVAYLIPPDRTPQPNAVANLQETLIAMRAWYCEQMDRNGAGKLAPRFELEADDFTPVIHTVNLNPEHTSAWIREGAVIYQARAAAVAAGVPVLTPGRSGADSGPTCRPPMGTSSGALPSPCERLGERSPTRVWGATPPVLNLTA
jgi:hypothetical protein